MSASGTLTRWAPAAPRSGASKIISIVTGGQATSSPAFTSPKSPFFEANALAGGLASPSRLAGTLLGCVYRAVEVLDRAAHLLLSTILTSSELRSSVTW